MKKYAIVGAGSRGKEMYAGPLSRDYRDVAKIVGVYDLNYKRSELLKRDAGGDFPVYSSFEEMLNDSKPDVVIVTTIDRFHHEYIIKALEAGCDVISEKPMTIDAEKCNAIIAAEKKTGRKVTVTFNARYSPFATRIKELVKSGSVGKVLSVHFEWLLDTSHGADYFRRWHRKLENSGGLLVHKATHHFDLVNWFIEQDPVSINAFGTRSFYGPTREKRGERCLTCKYKKECSFYFDLSHPELKEMYLDAEDVDGYFRDRCIFSEDINIYDTMSLNVKYSGGALMSYSLTAHSPYEGYKININGTGGRLEAEYFQSSSEDPFAAIAADAVRRFYRKGEDAQNKLRVYNRKGEELSIKVPSLSGTHGGSDERLRDTLFRGVSEDPLGYAAGTRAGAMSLIIGAGANVSIREGKAIKVSDLLKL
jgi:predicted dehydrogenase